MNSKKRSVVKNVLLFIVILGLGSQICAYKILTRDNSVTDTYYKGFGAVEPDEETEWRHTECFVHWCAEKTIEYYIHQDGCPDLSYPATLVEIDSACDVWQNVESSYISFDYQGSTSSKHSPTDGKNVIFWASDVAQVDDLDPWVAGCTIITIDTFQRIQDVDIWMNTDIYEYEDWCDDGSDLFDVSRWVMHELGHLQGLAHSDDGQAVMNAYFDADKMTLDDDDIAAVSWMYDTDFIEVGITYDEPVEEAEMWGYQATGIPECEIYPHISIRWYYYQEEISKGPPAGVWFHLEGYDNYPYCVAQGNDPGIRIALAVEDANGDIDSLVEYVSITSSKKGPKNDSEELRINHSYELEANSPNPFNPTTCIRYSLASESKVTLSIFNTLGERVRTLESALKPKGAYSIVWDSKDDRGCQVSAGIYIYRIEAIPTFGEVRKPFFASRKMLLAK
jgi:hypothetical protein